VSTEGIGVLCQLGSEGNFRAELVQWMPGYNREDDDTPPGAEEVLTPPQA
jgi:hypothetical protein